MIFPRTSNAELFAREEDDAAKAGATHITIADANAAGKKSIALPSDWDGMMVWIRRALRVQEVLFPGGSLRREISTVYRQLRKKEGQLKDLCTRQHVGAILTFIAQAHADYFRQRATKEELLRLLTRLTGGEGQR